MNYILDFKNTTTDEQISSYLTENNLSVIKTYNHFDKIFIVSSLNLPPKTDILEHVIEDHSGAISFLENTDIITYNSAPININLTEEKNWWKIAVFNKVDFDQENQLLNRLGSNITIYLVDSGVDLSHPEFIEGRVQNLFSFNNNFTDTRGHGTALASVITGKDCGISNATVKSVKIFDTNQPTLQSDFLSAFDSIVLDYIQNNQKLSIVNLSWSIAKNSYIESKIDYLISLGIPVLCAAGNSGVPITEVTPASMPNIIRVGAFNQHFEPCNFSNYLGGSHISVTENQTNYSENASDMFGWSPGEMIYSAKLDGTCGYSAGTSVACAIASAVLAHNEDLYLTNDGVIFPSFSTIPLRVLLNKFLFSRSSILNLQSPYNLTPNTITTMLTELPSVYHDLNLNEIRIIGMFETYIKIKLCDEKIYQKITYPDLSFISPDLKISNGFLVGTVRNNTELKHQQFNFPITFTKNDDSSLNLTLTLTLGDTIKDLKEANVPTSSIDPAITITLQDDACCQYTGGSCQNVSLDACTNSCGLTCIDGGYDGSLGGTCIGTKTANCSCSCLCCVNFSCSIYVQVPSTYC